MRPIRSNATLFLVVLLVLTLSYLTGHTIWKVKASKVAARVQEIMADGGGAKDMNEAIGMFDEEMVKARGLANTCLLAGTCTLKSQAVAKAMIATEIDRDALTIEKNQIKEQALVVIAKARAQFEKDGKLDVLTLRAEIGPLQDKYNVVIAKMRADTKMIYNSFPSAPESMKPIFENTF